jgi:hypothetical protein
VNELQLIPVPGGILSDPDQPDVAVLRLVVVPRLESGTLDDNGLRHWPPAELSGPFEVVFRATTAAPEEPPLRVTAVTRFDQEGVWEAITRDATVAPRPARVVPAAGIAAPPDRVEVAPTVTDAAAIQATYAATAAMLTDDTPEAHAAVAQAATAELASTWATEQPAEPVGTGSTRANADPTDLGTILGHLREFPVVLRAMGLVVELRFDATALPAFDQGQVRVDWPGHVAVTPQLPDLRPRWTAYDRELFLPGGAGDDLRGGMVRLDDESRWTVLTVDVDTATSRLRAAAAGTGPVAGLPALRTAGMSLARRDRQADFDRRRAAADADAEARSEANELPVLTAYDVALGYRLDVALAGTNTWYALCGRTATYTLETGGPEPTVLGIRDMPDEGHVKAHSAVRNDQGALTADQIVTRWVGSSLAVPDPRHGSGRREDGRRPMSGAPYQLDWRFNVEPGSFPPLRFGVSYEFRARLADIAGGGIAFGDPSANRNRTEEKRFGRHEPVLPPRVGLTVPRAEAALGRGARIDRLVVRSAGGPAHPPPTDVLAAEVERTLSPPVGSVDQAVQHGVLTGSADATFELLAPFASGEQELADCASGGVAAMTRGVPEAPDRTLVSDNWSAWPTSGTKSLRLQPRTDTISGQLAWHDGELVVTLAPAEEIEVELSSSLPRSVPGAPSPISLQHFDISDAVPGGAAAPTAAGRNPMVTPPQVVACVHAVVTPINTPTGAFSALRGDSETVAVLATDAVLGVHTGSTEQVDITASWTEVADDVRTPVVAYPVQSVPVRRTDTRLSEEVRHPFPDTRHRAVTYTATAVSRFREYFEGVPDEDFLVSGPLGEPVHVLSTSRPAQPVVRSVMPAFTWSSDTEEGVIVRRRRGGRLRVELARPWFTTGEGEQLAVLLAPTGPGGPDGARDRCTQVARDPSHAGNDWAAPAQWPVLTQLTAASATARLTLPGWQSAPDATPLGDMVDVAAHDVWLAGDSWYADVAIDEVAELTYCPFVRLSVARYQEHSNDGLFLSAPVLTDFVPLLPDRELRIDVTSTPGVAQVAVIGKGPQGTMNSDDVSAANRVDVLVEVGGDGPDGAIVVGGSSPGAWSLAASTSGRQGAMISVPLDGITGKWRIRVREVEEFVGTPAATPGTAGELSERVIFADAVTMGI